MQECAQITCRNFISLFLSNFPPSKCGQHPVSASCPYQQLSQILLLLTPKAEAKGVGAVGLSTTSKLPGVTAAGRSTASCIHVSEPNTAVVLPLRCEVSSSLSYLSGKLMHGLLLISWDVPSAAFHSPWTASNDHGQSNGLKTVFSGSERARNKAHSRCLQLQG